MIHQIRGVSKMNKLFFWSVIVVPAATLSCKTSNQSSVKALAGTHTVMIVDDGFDASHPVFKDQVVATYRLVCDSPKEAESGASSDEEKAAEAIRLLKNPRSSCDIKEGIKFSTASDYKKVVNKRDLWNSKIMEKTLSKDDLPEVRSAISGYDSKRNYHGTNVAGVIAYKNEDVKLVFLQIELGKAGDAVVDDEGYCPKQKDIDQWVRVYSLPKVKKTYIESPVDAVTDSLYKLAEKHKVTLVNMSLGASPRKVLEQSLKDAGCDAVDLKAQFTLQGELDKKQTEFRNNKKMYPDYLKNVLGVKAAGNHSARIDSLSDESSCAIGDDSNVTVGSHDASGKRSVFSNYGRCVDLYVLGNQVVTAAPMGFLNVVDGTSFSAPLFVRFATQKFPSGTSPTAIKSGMKQIADDQGFLKESAYPIELSFESDKKITVFTLTDERPTAASTEIRHWYSLTRSVAAFRK
jgi:Subtilase family